MRNLMNKGSISAILAVAAVLLLIFSINSAMNAREYQQTFTKDVAYRQVALKTEQAMDIVDKKLSMLIHEKAVLTFACPPGDLPTTIAPSFDANLATMYKDVNAVNCRIKEAAWMNNNSPIAGEYKISGKIICFSQVLDSNIVVIRNFIVDKLATPSGGSCDVNDFISHCREQPISGFECKAP